MKFLILCQNKRRTSLAHCPLLPCWQWWEIHPNFLQIRGASQSLSRGGTPRQQHPPLSLPVKEAINQLPRASPLLPPPSPQVAFSSPPRPCTLHPPNPLLAAASPTVAQLPTPSPDPIFFFWWVLVCIVAVVRE